MTRPALYMYIRHVLLIIAYAGIIKLFYRCSLLSVAQCNNHGTIYNIRFHMLCEIIRSWRRHTRFVSNMTYSNSNASVNILACQTRKNT